MNYADHKKSLGAYAADVHVGGARAPLYIAAVALGWTVFPYAVQTVLHPTDAIWLQMKLQGLAVPPQFTAQQAVSGLVEAVFALCILVLLQLVFTALFYRRAKMDPKPENSSAVATPVLWPLAALWGLIA